MQSKVTLMFARVVIVGFVYVLLLGQETANRILPHVDVDEIEIITLETLNVDSSQTTEPMLIDDTSSLNPIDTESARLRSVRNSNQCLDLINEQGHCLCDYVNLKGVRKSGTSWMINTLKKIRDYFCNERSLDDMFNAPFCKKGHVSAYSRHELVLPEDIDDHRLMSRFNYNRTLFQQELNRTRYCTVTVFRDPRDRWVSEAYWDAGTPNDSTATFDMINNKVRYWVAKGKIREDISHLNDYWSTFRNEERKDPSRFYNYFYDDMVLDTFDGLKHLVEFIGLYQVDGLDVNDQDIANILDLSSHDTMKKEGININFRRGSVCGFGEELTKENVELFQRETIQGLDSELMEKFNVTCPM